MRIAGRRYRAASTFSVILLRALCLATALISVQQAGAQTAPPVTLPGMKIGVAALIGQTAAENYYSGRIVTATGLATLQGIPAGVSSVPPEIVELARALKENPDLIYDYVHNNIDVAWMYGLQKGALGALIDKSGTAFDQAALMIALLNQAGYSASYMAGTISPSPAQFTAWTGISDANAACQMLANGGIPGTVNGQQNVACSAVASGAITSITLGHIWVSVNIPGSTCSTACLFDPAYKPYTKFGGLGMSVLESTMGLTPGIPLSTATTGMDSGTLSGSGSTAVPYVHNLTPLDSTLAGYAQGLLNCIQSDCHGIGTKAPQMEDIVGGGVIVPTISPPGGLRQGALPYTVSASHTWSCPASPLALCTVPNQYRTTLRVQGYMWDYYWFAGQPSPPPGAKYDTMFDVTFFADETYGRALTVGTDYGNINPDFVSQNNKYANNVTLQVDGVAVAPTYRNPGIWEGYGSAGFPIYLTSRGAPSYFTLTADHPYAADADGSATANGTYMDAKITKSVVVITPLTIVDGWGDSSGALFAKWSDEKPADAPMPIILSHCPAEDPPGLCVNAYPGGQGDFDREKLTAGWLAQYTRAAHLHAAVAGAVVQLHHMLGFSYGDSIIGPTYLTNPPINEDPQYPQLDNFNRLDVDSGLSLETRAPNAAGRRAAIQAFAASAAALEASAAAQLDDLPDTASTATRFEWGNAPPGTANNADAPNCASANAYEDPGCPGARKFVQFTPTNSGQAVSDVLIENKPLSSYASATGSTPTGSQPQLGSLETSTWSSAYTQEITAYTAAGFNVVTSQEAFLGPGQRGGGNIQWATITDLHGGTDYVSYVDSPSKQRGPAFVATLYDGNGDPLEIAHDIVALGPYGSSPFITTKGGGGGAEPNQGTSYNPSDAADILKSRFVDKSNALGVNLSNGSMGYSAPAKLDVGNGGFPYALSAALQWNPVPPPASYEAPPPLIAPPAGWTTNWHNRLTMSGSGLEGMGKSDVREAVGAIAAFVAAQDIYSAAPSPQRDVAGVLTQAWWSHQIAGNVVSVSLGTDSKQFLGLPQGVTMPVSGASWFMPGAGGFATLAVSGTRTAYEQRCSGPIPGSPYAVSRGWNYSAMSFALTNTHGDTENFAYWSNLYSLEGDYECGFAQGFRLNTWTFPQGPTVTLAYGNPINPQLLGGGPHGFDQLLSVSNGLGRTIDFADDSFGNLTGFNNALTGADARSVLVTPTSSTDPLGNTTSFAYLPAQAQSPATRPVPHPQLAQIHTADKPLAANTQYNYDSEGRVASIQDAEALQVGDRAAYEFFIADGARGERDDPLGNAWAVYYDIYGHPARYIDERGFETDASADSRGRVTQYIYPEGDQELFQFDDQNNTTLYTKVAKTGCTGSCTNLVVGATWDQTWNKPLTITDANGNLTTFVYYPSGSGKSLLETATRPADHAGNHPVYSFTYDSAGKLYTANVPFTTSQNIVTQNHYDSSEDLTSTVTDPGTLALTTSFTYDANGDIKNTVDPNGNTKVSTFDLDRRKIEDDHFIGATSTMLAAERTKLDVVGRDYEDDVAKCFDNATTCPASGAAVVTWIAAKSTTFTPTWKPATVTDADGRVSATAYDALDRVSVVTDPMFRQTQFTYDQASNKLTEVRGLGTPAQAIYATYTYGAEGEKLTEMDADGALATPQYATAYFYDGFNRLISSQYPDGTSNQVTSYDADSNILTSLNRAGEAFTFTYDALNRMLTKLMPAVSGINPAVTTSWVYYLNGAIADLSDSAGNDLDTTNAGANIYYDTAGRQVRTDTTIPGITGALATKYVLDANGNRTQLTWPDGYFYTYAYDALDRMTTAEESGTSDVMSYQYDPLSRRTSLNFRAGVMTSAYTYTDAGDLTALNLTTTTGVIPNYTLAYTNAHQLSSETSSQSTYVWQPPATGTDAYTAVNKLNQYPSWTPSGSTLKSFIYDANGNMLTGTIAGAAWAMTYDPENRMLTAGKTTGGTVAATYAYDPLGRRNAKSGTGVTATYFLDDGVDEIAEYTSTGAVAMRYIPGPAINEPIMSVTGSGTHRFIQTDHHGSVIAVASLGGSETEGPYLYDPHGNCFVGTTPCNTLTTSVPYKFVGMRLDAETGFYFDRARFYSSAIGRFFQTDSIGYTADLNLYTYVGNDPTDKTDPTGKIAGVDDAVEAGVALVVATGAVLYCEATGCMKPLANWAGRKYNDFMHRNDAKPAPKPNTPAPAQGQGAPAATPAATPNSGGNTNPYPATGGGPVDQPVVVVDPAGNAIPVNPGEQVVGSPNGDYQQVQDRNGNPTGVRLDRGGHRGQSDPSARGPHAHVPGVTQPNGNPHLPVCTATPGTPCP
jgi:RHS repeat-associated protein